MVASSLGREIHSATDAPATKSPTYTPLHEMGPSRHVSHIHTPSMQRAVSLFSMSSRDVRRTSSMGPHGSCVCSRLYWGGFMSRSSQVAALATALVVSMSVATVASGSEVAVESTRAKVSKPSGGSAVFWEQGLWVRYTPGRNNNGVWISLNKAGQQGPVAALYQKQSPQYGYQEVLIPWKLLASANKSGEGTYVVNIYSRNDAGGYGPGIAVNARNIAGEKGRFRVTSSKPEPWLMKKITTDPTCVALGVTTGSIAVITGFVTAGVTATTIVGAGFGVVIASAGAGEIAYSTQGGCEKVEYELVVP